MKQNNPVIVYEHSVLKIGDSGFSELHFDALVKFNDLHNGKYFSVGFKKIIFKSYVGVIQVDQYIIEILPKADKVLTTDNNTKTKWQNILLSMLKKCGYIKLNETNIALQNIQRGNLMDVYLFAFLKELEQLVHKGLIKKYRRIQANKAVMKGRLLIAEQIRHNTIHRERFFTNHVEYDRDNFFNQVLKSALVIIESTTINSSLRQQAAKLLLYFDEIALWTGEASELSNILIDHKTQSYKYILELAKMIILHHCPNMKSGIKPILALLFDMNLLFEKFIYRMLKSQENSFKIYKLSISQQQTNRFWMNKTIRPDIIITFNQSGKSRKIIVDTKWKIVKDGYPSDEDLKQMFTYNIQFDAEHSILLYPHINQKNSGRKVYHESLRNLGFSHSCEMHFINLFNKDDINFSFAKEFLLHILNMQFDLQV